MTRPLTDKQCELMNYLWGFFIDNDQLPPVHVIARHFGWSSPNAAHEKLQGLSEIHGFLEKNTVNKWKFTEKSRQDMAVGPYISNASLAMRELAKRVISQRLQA